MSWLALDIGGANLKLADGRGFARSCSFSLWREPQNLAAALGALLDGAPTAERLAVTMTGELADCFATKAEGVAAIVGAAQQAARGRSVWIYLTDGQLVPPARAAEQSLKAAASNWHALARFACRYAASGTGLLIDIGTTTTDIIPLADGRPDALGLTDPERLASGELVYTGVVRSPVAAVARTLPWRDRSCGVAQELFATMQDVYLVLGDLEEEPDNCNTADSRPATRQQAICRLARMVCADRELFSDEDARAAAAEAARCHQQLITSALLRVIDRAHSAPQTVVLSGRGEFLARRVLADLGLPVRAVSLSEQLDGAVSVCAAAHALAVLAGASHP